VFDVKVKAVNTIRVQGKAQTFSRVASAGVRTTKAIVTLGEAKRIDVTAEI
jgi:ribosomal protein L23